MKSYNLFKNLFFYYVNNLKINYDNPDSRNTLLYFFKYQLNSLFSHPNQIQKYQKKFLFPSWFLALEFEMSNAILNGIFISLALNNLASLSSTASDNFINNFIIF